MPTKVQDYIQQGELAMSKVALAKFEFDKPVPTAPEPLTAFPEQFLVRLAEIEAKSHTVMLRSGREMCYFDETGPGDADMSPLPVVLCIHGGGQSKELWMQPDPIPNVRIIAIDRIGSGSSSPQPAPFGFKEVVSEIGELLDKVGVDRFYVVGHSIGGGVALQVAAGLGSGDNGRVLGCASISGQCDLYHATAPKRGSKEWKSLVPSTVIANACAPNAGCWGACVRNLILKRVLGSMMFAENKARDCGFQAMYTGDMRKGDGGCERTWTAMDNDTFFVSTQLYSILNGGVDTNTPLGDIWRAFAPFHYDCSDFKGPTFIYNGEKETTLLTQAEQNHRAIPQSELVVMEGHGHTTIMMEAPRIIQALVTGKSAQQAF